MDDKKIDWDYYETVIAYGLLMDEAYLAATVDYIKPSYFNDKDISRIVAIISQYFKDKEYTEAKHSHMWSL